VELRNQGIWLQDLAKTVPPTAELVGIDIEENLFPQPSTLPPNLHFQVQSVLDLPKEWTNKFDLVHQRLLLLGLRDAEWRKALGEINRVLKPGGWFQMLEIDEWEQSGPKLTVFKELIRRLLELRGVEGFWPNGSIKWQRYAEEAGFVDVRMARHYAPIGKWAGQDGIYGKENKLGLLRGSKKALVALGLVDEKEFDELLEQADQEMNSHPGTRARYIIICAQKPAK